MSLYIISNGNIESEPVAPQVDRSNVILDEIPGEQFSAISMSWVRMHAKELKMEHESVRQEMLLDLAKSRRELQLVREDQGVVDGNFFRGVRYASLFTGILVLFLAMIWRAVR